ncbi:retrotransposon protein, putative, ty1-copia subclass [Tanacetum coccineum]
MFDEEIKKFGFTLNHDEPCVYVKASGNVTFLILYVDDILIMGNYISMLQDVKSYPGKFFAMKDLGEATYILKMKMYKDRSRRPILSKAQGASTYAEIKGMHRIPYASDVGSIMNAKSAKQSTIETSSTEAEYMTALEASKEAAGIRKFISGLGVITTNEEPIIMYCDNNGAIIIANELRITRGAKHY